MAVKANQFNISLLVFTNKLRVLVSFLLLGLIFFPFDSEAEPLFNHSASQCGQIDIKKMNDKSANELESIYCGFKIGLKYPPKYTYFGIYKFSTQNNIDGHVMHENAKIKKSCEFGYSQVTGLLESKFPSASINCSKFKDYDELMFDESKAVVPSVAPTANLAESAEVIVISGYQPTKKIIKINVDRPNSKVLLILTTAEKTNWIITATPTTVISGIVTTNQYHKSTITTSVDTKVYATSLAYAYKTDSQNFVSLLNELSLLFGVTRVDVFLGSYYVPANVNINSIDAPTNALTIDGPRPKRPANSVNFTLLTSTFKKADWTLEGPYKKENSSYLGDGACLMRRYTASDSGNEIFSPNESGLDIRLQNVRSLESIKLPLNFPKFTWGSDTAYDAKRKIITLVSHGGVAYLYRYNTLKKEWVDFHLLSNNGIRTITYEPIYDRYIAWSDRGELVQISSQGDVKLAVNVISLLTGIGLIYDVANSPGPCLSLAANGNDVALIDIDIKGKVRLIWHYNFSSNKAELTYKSPKD